MAETAVKFAFGDFGGTGVRGYAVDSWQSDLAACDTFTIPLEAIEGEGHLQELVDDGFRDLAERGDFRFGAAVLAVDGPEDREFKPGSFTSHKTRQRIDPEITSSALGCPAVAENDVMAMTHGLKTLTAKDLVGRYLLRSTRRDIADGFRDARAVAVTVSSGVGAGLFNSQPDGSVQVTSMHAGHQSYQPHTALEKRLYEARSAAQRADGDSEVVTVEQAISGGSILSLVELIDEDYASELQQAHGGDFNTIGKLVVSHALEQGHTNHEAAKEVMEARAGILGGFIRDLAAAQEAQAVVLTGGGMIGLEQWVAAPDSTFQRRVSAVHRDHAYRPPHVILGPQDLGLRGGIQHARELAGMY